MTTPCKSSRPPGPIKIRRPPLTGRIPYRRDRHATVRCKAFCPTGQAKIRNAFPRSLRPCRRARCVIKRPPTWRANGRRTILQAALAWTQELPASEGQRRALQSVLSSWAQNDPTAAADYVATLPAGKMQEDAVRSIAQQLANTNLQTALSWAQKLPEGATRQNALNPIVAQWSETDPQGAVEFALTQQHWRSAREFAATDFAAMGAERSASRAQLGAKFIRPGGAHRRAAQHHFRGGRE